MVYESQSTSVYVCFYQQDVLVIVMTVIKTLFICDVLKKIPDSLELLADAVGALVLVYTVSLSIHKN